MTTPSQPRPITPLDELPESMRGAVQATIAATRAQLGDRVLAIYTVGSAGYGGYVPGWSDVDVDVIVRDGPEPADALLERGYAVRAEMHRQGHAVIDVKCYSLAILNDEHTDYEYGIANRAVMLLDSARRVFGDDVTPDVRRPGRARLIAEGRRLLASFAAKPDDWWATRPLDDTAALLALPGRVLLTSETGRVEGKLHGLDLLLSKHAAALPAGCWVWVCWARAVRSLTPAREVPESALGEARAAARMLHRWASCLELS